MEAVFWICLGLVVYPYAIYPIVLTLLARSFGSRAGSAADGPLPSVTVILPVHNEAYRCGRKVGNLLELDYPAGSLDIIVVGDGCEDDSLDRAKEAGGDRVTVIALLERGGKARALNAGLEAATGEIVMFTDAGIMLERGALRHLVADFRDPRVGCVSGEDRIEGGASEGLYGRLEILLRREESALHSIAGASGCLYAQRRELCSPFLAGMAPDFLSVLNTVRAGKRALAAPGARGSMAATAGHRAEFDRKVRTLLRGMTALFAHAGLLNPFRYGAFSFILWSHKVLRWLAPLPALGCLVTSWLLREQVLYLSLFGLQFLLYAIALAGVLWPSLARSVVLVRFGAFFVLVHAAALKALLLWLVGVRVEIWEPTRRPG